MGGGQLAVDFTLHGDGVDVEPEDNTPDKLTAGGYDGLGLGLNRSVNICMCFVLSIKFSVYIRPGSAYYLR